MSKEAPFISDPKEQARWRLRYFDNFAVLTQEQVTEKENILNSYPDLRYFT